MREIDGEAKRKCSVGSARKGYTRRTRARPKLVVGGKASVWNERMLAALDNGVQGGKWFSLIDKVYRPATLLAAWRKVAANAGAAGVDGQSVERFAARAQDYLVELEQALKGGTYEPLPVKRMDIPKAPGNSISTSIG